MGQRDFSSLSAFAAHVIDVGRREIVADGDGRRAVAETVTHTAQSMIGKPSNFAPLAPRTVQERLRLGYTPYETLLRSGDYKRSFMWARDNSRATSVGSTSPHAPYHELGTPNNRPPKRSVLIDPTKKRDRTLFDIFVATYLLRIRA